MLARQLLELETQMLIAKDLQFLPGPEAAELIERSGKLGRMLNSLIESLQQYPKSSGPAA